MTGWQPGAIKYRGNNPLALATRTFPGDGHVLSHTVSSSHVWWLHTSNMATVTEERISYLCSLLTNWNSRNFIWLEATLLEHPVLDPVFLEYCWASRCSLIQQAFRKPTFHDRRHVLCWRFRGENKSLLSEDLPDLRENYGVWSPHLLIYKDKQVINKCPLCSLLCAQPLRQC